MVERMKKMMAEIIYWILEKLIPIQIWISSSKRTNWISHKATKEIKKHQKKDRKSFYQRISEKWFEWMHPQKWLKSLALALSLIFIPQVILFFCIHLTFKFLDVAGFLATMWQVLASIIGISFVIVIFITQYAQDQAYERRAFPIYISSTSMIFVAMMGLLTLMSMGINLFILNLFEKGDNRVINLTIWNAVLFLLNLILTIYLYVRTYQLLSPSYFREVLVKYQRKIIIDRVYEELLKRLKQNLANDEIQNFGIETSLLTPDNSGKVKIKIETIFTESQIINDINTHLINIASKNAKRFGNTYEKQQIIFWGLPGRNISKEYSEIAAINPEINRKLVTQFLQNSIKTVDFNSSITDSISENLLINQDIISSAIAAGQTESIEALLNLYIEPLDCILDFVKQVEADIPESINKKNGWFNKWDIFNSIHQQYLNLLSTALKSNNIEIINTFVRFPISVMVKAIEYHDHYAFREFANLYLEIYLLLQPYISDAQIRHQVAECGQLLTEFAKYKIKYRLLDNDLGEEEAKELVVCAEDILKVFSELAKHQIDKADFLQYKLTVGSIRQLLDDFTEDHDIYKVNRLELDISYITNQAEKAEFTKKLQKEKMLNLLATNLQKIRRAALFGLGTWICHLLDIGKISEDQFEKFSKPINQEFNDLNVLGESDALASQMGIRRVFNWNNWEMAEQLPDAYGETKFIQMHFSSWFSLYYTYRALELMPENPEAILEIKPEYNSGGTLDSTRHTIKHFTENKNWENIINKLGNLKVRTQILEKSLEIAHTKQLEIEEIEIIQTALNENKIKEFFETMEQEWQESGIGRKIFIAFQKYYPRPEAAPSEALIPFGIYQRIPKGVFIENPKIGYGGWGRSDGNSMAKGEDRLISLSYNQLPSIPMLLENFDSAILENISLLRSKGLNPIILYGNNLHKHFFESTNYEPKWKTKKTIARELENFDGFYNDVVVFRYFLDPDTVVIYDPAKFADMVQYRVNEDIGDFPLSYSVKEISQERAKEYLVTKPDLKKHPKTGDDLSEEDAIRRIQQDVELTIWQRFGIENINPDSGIRIEFKKIISIIDKKPVQKKTKIIRVKSTARKK